MEWGVTNQRDLRMLKTTTASADRKVGISGPRGMGGLIAMRGREIGITRSPAPAHARKTNPMRCTSRHWPRSVIMHTVTTMSIVKMIHAGLEDGEPGCGEVFRIRIAAAPIRVASEYTITPSQVLAGRQRYRVFGISFPLDRSEVCGLP